MPCYCKGSVCLLLLHNEKSQWELHFYVQPQGLSTVTDKQGPKLLFQVVSPCSSTVYL